MTTLPLRRQAAALVLAVGSAMLAHTAIADTRTMIVTSDPQYPWTQNSEWGRAETDAERDRLSEALITEQYRSIAAYRAARPGQDIPVFINGDLTAYGHDWQRAVMQRLYSLLGDNVHLGLGNHDYANNIRKDDGKGCYNNGCARDSISDLIGHVTRKKGNVSFDFSVQPGAFSDLYTGSLAYAVDAPGFDRILNVQLNNNPAYTVSFNTTQGVRRARYDIGSSLPWLRTMLDEHLTVPRYGTPADRSHDFALLHVHDATAFDEDFEKLVSGADVAAIFAGHLHRYLGRYSDAGQVPVFLSGSASERTYLIVEHDTDSEVLRVYGVRENAPENKQLIDTVPTRRAR